jgi:hypothetical protein
MLSVLEFLLPSSFHFFFYFLPLCIILLRICLFFAIGSIHQEAQAVNFNCSCTSGFTDCICLLPYFQNSIVSCTSGLLRLQLSSTKYQVQVIAVLQNYLGYNYFLRFLKFQVLRLFFPEFSFGYHHLIT